MKIDRYYVSPKGGKAWGVKSGVIGIYDSSDNTASAAIYLKKATWVSDESYERICKAIRLELPKGFEVFEL